MTNKTKHIVASIINGIIILISGFAISTLFFLKEFVSSDVSVEHIFLLFSLIVIAVGSLVGVVSSLISIITMKEDPRSLSLIRSTSVTASTTLLIYEVLAICVSGKFMSLISYGFIFWLALVAVANVVSYCVFEVSYKKTPWYGSISGVLYLVFVIAAALPMWDVKKSFAILGDSAVSIYLTMVGIVLLSLILGIVFVAINNTISKILTILLPSEDGEEVYSPNITNVSFSASEEVVEGPSDDETQETAVNQIEIIEDSEDSQEVEEAEERKQAAEDKKNNYNDRPRVYHISKHQSSGKWQVKLATGKKAIRLFKTQAEAIAYAKELIGTQGGSIRIHSLKGKLRKGH